MKKQGSMVLPNEHNSSELDLELKEIYEMTAVQNKDYKETQ